jgi:hypothetical protein
MLCLTPCLSNRAHDTHRRTAARAVKTHVRRPQATSKHGTTCTGRTPEGPGPPAAKWPSAERQLWPLTCVQAGPLQPRPLLWATWGTHLLSGRPSTPNHACRAHARHTQHTQRGAWSTASTMRVACEGLSWPCVPLLQLASRRPLTPTCPAAATVRHCCQLQTSQEEDLLHAVLHRQRSLH